MNAIIALCHFCEQHGPNAVFCTQVIRGNLKDCLTDPPPAPDFKNCAACLSIGQDLVFLSTENAIQFVSTQSPVLSSTIVAQIKHSAFRSLSCDIYPKRESGFVFFGDSTKGHVLSHAFEIQDQSARGQRKLYSIIILMKDKMFLLNIEPFLSDYLQKISKELQEQASTVFKSEQGNKKKPSPGPPLPRSLAELTGEKNVFARLHSHFCWLLWGGGRYLSEHVTIGSPYAPPWLGHDTEEGFTMIQIDKEEWLMRKKFGTDFDLGSNDLQVTETLRKFFYSNRTGFLQAVFCCLTGTTVLVRGDREGGQLLARGFSKLLPDNFSHRIDLNATKIEADKKIIFLLSDGSATPLSSKLCLVECLPDGSVSTKWTGELPSRLPIMLQKIVKFCDEKMFNEETLQKQLKVLVHEWKHKVVCLKHIQNTQDFNKMKKVLGVQPHDDKLVNYWISTF